jgi:NADPH-dependent 2,4-dienoyl-CoA reductase/sulfur reductase-like enzyme
VPDYDYLIVGGGMTGDAAVRGIRDVDPTGSIGLIGAEPDPPYNRPPLSKGLWKGTPLDTIWRKFKGEGAELHLGRTAIALDPAAKRVTDDQGAVYGYGKLLLATGGTPRRLAFGADRIIYYRTLADYRRLRALAERGQRFGVIGGGFIGQEVAAALAANGKEVIMVVPDATIGARLFPPDLGAFLNHYYQERGVTLLLDHTADAFDQRGDQQLLTVRSGAARRDVVVDGVVAGVGIEPNVALARQAGLKLDNGVWVDAALRTSAPDVFAAGDVANFFNPALGRRIRVEHEDNANTQGRLAGRNMAGRGEPYHHLPSFYSDLFDLGYEAVGEIDARLEIVADWQAPFRKGVLYYLRDARVRGVLLWNVWDRVAAATELITAPGPVRPADLKGRLT